MCMWINNEASSSTLIEGLAPHNHKRHYKINWNHEKAKLTIEKRSQRPQHDKSHAFCSLRRLPTLGLQNKKFNLYQKAMFSCVLTGYHECARSQSVRSIALRSIAESTLERIRGFKFHAARPFNDDSRVSADVACTWSQSVCSIAESVIDRTTKRTRVILCWIFTLCLLMSMTCNTLEIPKTNKHIRKRHS